MASIICAAAVGSALRAGDRAPDLLRSPWPADWITFPGAPQKGQGVYRFRKRIQLGGVPGHYVVRVSADNRFIFFVNGVRVGDGPARGDLDHWRYETYDIAPFLRPGDNVLGAVVWNYGPLAPVAQLSDRTGFLVNGDTPSESAANTDRSWEAEEEAGQGFLAVDPADVPNYYAASPGERLDGARYDWDWQTSSGGWSPAAPVGAGEPGRYPGATPVGTGTGNNRWLLVEDQLPKMEFTEIPVGRIVRVEGMAGVGGFPVQIPANSRVRILVDRGTMTTAYPELTTSGGNGAAIRISYAEALVDERGEKGDRNEVAGRRLIGLTDQYLPDGGERVWSTLWWRAWRYLQLDVRTGKEPVTLGALGAHFTGYPFRELAGIEASDPVLARIWETGTRTARMNAHETYSDCPYWEQLQYVGDTRLQALISYVEFGDDRLARQALDAYDRSRSAEGLSQSRFPSALPQYIPPFSLLWIGMLHDYWMYRPDPSPLAAWVPHTRSVIAWYASHERPDGLLGVMPWWNYADWTRDFDFGVPPQDAGGGSALLSLAFVAGLRDAADLEESLGNAGLAAEYRERAGTVARAVYALCWDARRELLADTPARTHFSEQTNTLGVLLDAVPEDRQQAVMRVILAHGPAAAVAPPTGEFSPASIYFRFYVARAMDHAGMADLYLDSLGDWRRMLKIGLTTWAETADPTRSDDHAWSAHPNYDLLTLVAGIRPASPGFRTVVVAPHPGSLTSFSAHMPHPLGDITVRCLKSGESWRFEVDLPRGLSGEFRWGGRTTSLTGGANILNPDGR